MPRIKNKEREMSIIKKIFKDKKGLVAAGVAVVALATTAGVTLGGFSATIANPTNSFSSGTIQLSEGNGATTCFSTGTGTGGSVSAGNSGTCSAINDIVGTLDQVPGGTPLSTTITLRNVGNVATTGAALVTAACSAAAASDANGYVGTDTSGFCGKVDITVANTTSGATDKCVFPSQSAVCPALSSANTLASFASTTFGTTPMSALAAGASATYVITIQLDASATNADQGLTASIPMTWAITQ
jgi:hypothetical protein